MEPCLLFQSFQKYVSNRIYGPCFWKLSALVCLSQTHINKGGQGFHRGIVKHQGIGHPGCAAKTNPPNTQEFYGVLLHLGEAYKYKLLSGEFLQVSQSVHMGPYMTMTMPTRLKKKSQSNHPEKKHMVQGCHDNLCQQSLIVYSTFCHFVFLFLFLSFLSVSLFLSLSLLSVFLSAFPPFCLSVHFVLLTSHFLLLTCYSVFFEFSPASVKSELFVIISDFDSKDERAPTHPKKKHTNSEDYLRPRHHTQRNRTTIYNIFFPIPKNQKFHA